MIAPRNMLLAWAALATVPPALFYSYGAAPWHPLVAWTALLVIIAAGDALAGVLRAGRFSAALPADVRMTSRRDGTVTVTISNAGAAATILVGISGPEELGCGEDEQTVRVPDAPQSTVAFTCTPRCRGRMAVTAVHLGIRSPLGFWLVRRSFPGPAVVRVYPNLLPERQRLAARFLQREETGSRSVRQVGRGWEFEKLREYLPGDPFGDIHWKATARRGRPVTKVFQVERTQEIYVAIDASRLSGRPSGKGGEDMLTRQITAALLLGGIAERQGDLFGLAGFTDRVNTFIRAGRGRAHYRACRDAIYALRPAPVVPDFSEILSFFRLRLRRRALLIFLMSMDDPVLAEHFAEHAGMLARNHLVLVNMIRPPGTAALFSRPVAAENELFDCLAAHFRFRQIRALEKTLGSRGVFFTLSEDESYTADVVGRYMEIKQRQLL